MISRALVLWPVASAWRLVPRHQAEEFRWAVGEVVFFSDMGCSKLLEREGASPSGSASEDSIDVVFDMTDKGWWRTATCTAGTNDCWLQFDYKVTEEPKCLQVKQQIQCDDPDLQQYSLELQTDDGAVVSSWQGVGAGWSQLAMRCPEAPPVINGTVKSCDGEEKSRVCQVQCDAGYAHPTHTFSCHHGVWTKTACVPDGSQWRVVNLEPTTESWAVLDVHFYVDEACAEPISDLESIDGVAFSSPVFQTKYAGYSAANAFDNDENTGWASETPCEPEQCYLGVYFRQGPVTLRCVKIIQDATHARFGSPRVALQKLTHNGFETVKQLHGLRHDTPVRIHEEL
mmetsp:Transcript_8017/g.17477  ORF Transcript_8017/g.17477 Transcript_8017/m.17477 type:complete len:343 (+) Transcript_8017:20-1048(+)